MGNGVRGFYYCHGVTEIVPGLLLSGKQDAPQMAALGARVLIPLTEYAAEHPGVEIHPYRMPDGGTLPGETLEQCVGEILGHLQAGRKVGLFCSGGHGRTGYAAACVLGRMGIWDPIAFLRRNYCTRAVETFEQLTQIASFLNQPGLIDRYRSTVDPCRHPESER